MNNTTQNIQQVWLQFLTDFYSNRPRLKEQLEQAELIKTDNGYEIQSPLWENQEQWLKTGQLDGLYKNLSQIKRTLGRFASDYPGLENIHFSFKKADGTTILIDDEMIAKYPLDDIDDGLVAFKNSLTIENDLPDESHTYVAQQFAAALCKEDPLSLYELLNDNATMVAYKKRTIIGRNGFVDYWRWLWDLLRNTHYVTDYVVKFNIFTQHTAIYFNQRHYNGDKTPEACVLFHLVNKHISTAVITEVQQQPITVRYYDLNHPALDFDRIMKDKSDSLNPEPNRMPCLRCGRLSEDLEWYKLYVDNGPFAHIGQVSVCPHCKAEAEFYPEIFLRKDM